MEESILATIKKMLGLEFDYVPFDTEIIVFLNSAMMTLQQIGVGPIAGFTVSDYSQSWSDFLPSDKMLEGAKMYLYLCVKMAFDPPSSSFVMDAMKQNKEELEWRMREQAEYYPGEDTGGTTSDSGSGSGDVTREAMSAAALNRDNAPYDGEGFRVNGGWYSSDPGFPWADGPSQPAVDDTGGEGE